MNGHVKDGRHGYFLSTCINNLSGNILNMVEIYAKDEKEG